MNDLKLSKGSIYLSNANELVPYHPCLIINVFEDELQTNYVVASAVIIPGTSSFKKHINRHPYFMVLPDSVNNLKTLTGFSIDSFYLEINPNMVNKMPIGTLSVEDIIRLDKDRIEFEHLKGVASSKQVDKKQIISDWNKLQLRKIEYIYRERKNDSTNK